ncbi:hypothetical protein PLESTM_000655900 [Pleodorina starrii]|nr:hypothetical protein PLESTM_000655900 [Pleodorina starrii]
MKRTFGVGQPGPQPRSGHAPWWNEECAQKHAIMDAKLITAHGQDRSSAAWLAFREARQVYNRARRHAMAAFEQKEWREFISSCRGDPRALWQKLAGGYSAHVRSLREMCGGSIFRSCTMRGSGSPTTGKRLRCWRLSTGHMGTGHGGTSWDGKRGTGGRRRRMRHSTFPSQLKR